MTRQEYLESVNNIESLFSIIKYGLRGNAPSDVTVEDIYYLIQCNPL